MSQQILILEPRFHERVWGGQRLRVSQPPIGEAWIAGEANLVRNGRHQGRTVGELARVLGGELLGDQVAQAYGPRFPLLMKLLDCADWLSLQVHPNDAQARRMVGPAELGKTEAWFFIEASRGARVLAGVRAGTSRADLTRAIRDGQVLQLVREWEVRPGDALFIPAGTLHALGPGLLLYEVQQSSDTTYRVYDWDRPVSSGRKLHLDESIAVVEPDREPVLTHVPRGPTTGAVPLTACPYFVLEYLTLTGDPLIGDTERRSFHVITATNGAIELSTALEKATLQAFETAIIPANVGRYVCSGTAGRAAGLRASVPPSGARDPTILPN